MKYLRVTMPDGSRWDVPADFIAINRANYFAEKEKSYGTYAREYAFTMGDAVELKDWASNNMNWEDVEPRAMSVPTKPRDVDYQDGWTNGDKEIVER